MTAPPEDFPGQLSNIEWFQRTGHCGRCGNPGGYCWCPASDPCGCRDLHPVGSGRQADALEQFAEPVISADQEPLFGDTP